jgi:hydroxypyruvate isomerase
MLVPETRMTDPAYRASWLDALKKACEAAAVVGATRLITQVGPDTGAPRETQHAAIVETLKLAKPILEQYGVTVMPEPLNTKVNHPGYYLSSSAEAFEIIREVDSPYVKVIYDIYHQQITEGDIIPSVTRNLDCIAHLHAAGHPGRHELWEGELNYRYIFDAIDKAGLPLIGVVPEDDALPLSLNRGLPLLLTDSMSSAAQAYRNIANRIQGGRVALLRIK